ncbi:hypothetical protein RN001_001687 [Aquatica leii]|uniref:SWIM-type domain-containing protein n=1 Tax=Aquatica leii TaxID=1421715 RepID=A0AAN7PLG8_9COLE|nr:hypothetical protein RN001_001687 [Aquatica leii]
MDSRVVMVSINDYFMYMGGNTNSRRIYEGEEVFNAGHVILCGKVPSEKDVKDTVTIHALCLQTSSLQSAPHTIQGELNMTSNRPTVLNMNCSCKSGSSGRCKHISAVLIHCTRNNINNFEQLSQTDLKCKWSTANVKSNTKEVYKPVEIKAMPCFQKHWPKPIITISKEMEKNILENIGRRVEPIDDSRIINYQDIKCNLILNNASQSITMMQLSSVEVTIENCCKNFLLINLNEDPAVILETTKLSQKEWFVQRKFRITGSRIYEIFTYSSNNWITKNDRYFNPKNITNKFINHGLKYEERARNCFIDNFKVDVCTCGLIVPHNNNWLGYSPDGVVFVDNKPIALLEIKCPFYGKSLFLDYLMDLSGKAKQLIVKYGKNKNNGN